MTDELKPVAWMYDHNGTPNAYAYQLPDWSPAKGTETPLYSGTDVAALVEALRKVLPITVEDGPDYAMVYFSDGQKHRTQAMTMNPQDWLDIAALLERGEHKEDL